MASTDKLIEEKIRLLEQSPDKFVGKMTDIQKELLKDIKKSLSALDVKDGNIVTSQKNVDQILKIEKQIKKAFGNTEYAQAAEEMLADLKKTKALNTTYLRRTFGTLKDKAANIAYEANKSVVEEQLLGSQTFQSTIFSPLKKQILDGVTNGTTFNEMVDNIEVFINGDEKRLGVLQKYTKQIANDAFATTERNYASMVADALDVQFVRYVGGTVVDSRCFCEQRNGGYFHIEEVRAWGDGDLSAGGLDESCKEDDGWQGMYVGTNSGNIEQWLGGYNCKHSLVYVSEINVPDEVIERATQAGYFKP